MVQLPADFALIAILCLDVVLNVLVQNKRELMGIGYYISLMFSCYSWVDHAYHVAWQYYPEEVVAAKDECGQVCRWSWA